MKRSARSVPTGPGSRGGRAIDAAYFRDWRAAHPAYRHREVARAARRRAEAAEDRLPVLFTDVVVALISEGSGAAMARRLAVSPMAVSYWRRRLRTPSPEIIDAVVLVFGPSAVLRQWRSLLRARREAARLAARDPASRRPRRTYLTGQQPAISFAARVGVAANTSGS